MPNMDIFNDDAFSLTSLTGAMEKVDHVPQFITNLGLFEPVSVRTTEIWIEERSQGAALIQTSPRGSAPDQIGGDKSKVRAFQTKRLAQGSRITAQEVQNIRAFGTESELKQVQAEVARRQLQISRNFDLTIENMLLSTCMGVTKDADGSTIVDWTDALSQSIPSEITFDFSDATSLHKKCNDIRRTMAKNLKGVGAMTGVLALCSDTFWDAMTSATEIRQTYLNQQDAAALRDNVGAEWDMFRYRNITWVNYRGTDDGTSVGIADKKVKFLPLGAGIFKLAWAPHESFEYVNTPGQERYSMMVRDTQRDMWVDVEVYSYPLPVCTMPSALHQGKIT